MEFSRQGCWLQLLLLNHFNHADSVRPHRWQPTRLPCPWDSPGKDAGVGCYSLLQGIFSKETESSQIYGQRSKKTSSIFSKPKFYGYFNSSIYLWYWLRMESGDVYLSLLYPPSYPDPARLAFVFYFLSGAEITCSHSIFRLSNPWFLARLHFKTMGSFVFCRGSF